MMKLGGRSCGLASISAATEMPYLLAMSVRLSPGWTMYVPPRLGRGVTTGVGVVVSSGLGVGVNVGKGPVLGGGVGDAAAPPGTASRFVNRPTPITSVATATTSSVLT